MPEGTPARFVVQSASAAQGPFTVHLKVEETAGDCVAAADERAHTVSFAPQARSVAFGVPTVDDGDAERDCTVKVSLARANGTVPGAGTTTQVLTEGGDATFTLTASPAPAADLPVSVTVVTDGDWGVTDGGRTVTIPTSGSATLTLATVDDAEVTESRDGDGAGGHAGLEPRVGGGAGGLPSARREGGALPRGPGPAVHTCPGL